MKFVLMTFPSTSEKWEKEASQQFIEKINRFIQFEEIEIKTEKTPRDQSQLKVNMESKKLLSKINKDDFLILFDEKGKKLNSIEFSKSIEKTFMTGKKRVIFVIGGAYGVSDEVKNMADIKISFSDMVFNHLVAKIVLLEQIYRALTIIKNIPYHNI